MSRGTYLELPNFGNINFWFLLETGIIGFITVHPKRLQTIVYETKTTPLYRLRFGRVVCFHLIEQN